MKFRAELRQDGHFMLRSVDQPEPYISVRRKEMEMTDYDRPVGETRRKIELQATPTATFMVRRSLKK